MSNFVILADATCDLSEEFQVQYQIKLIPGHIHLPDDTEVQSFQKWECMTKEEFYAGLKKNPAGYSTSPASVEEFANAFEPYAAAGQDILCMCISSGLSGTYNFTLKARETILAKYPNVQIRCVDTLRFSAGFALMAIHAAELRAAGKSLDETAQYLEENKNRYHQAGWLDDLSFVAKKGRLTHAKAFFGTLAGVKPIGEFDYNGLTTVLGKARGAKAAYNVLLSYIEQTGEDLGNQTILIAQTNRMPQAQEYKRLIEEKFHPKAVYITDVFPSCGVNIGPGLMAAYYVGKPISEGLTEEKAIIENLLKES